MSHHRHNEPSRLAQAARTYRFEIGMMLMLAFGVFLVVERMNIRQSIAHWSRTAVGHAGNLAGSAASSLANRSLSDMIGIVLIMLAVAAVVLRVRWRLMRTSSLTDTICPSCGSGLHRSHRRPADRIINWLVPVRRYHCSNRACGWSGLRVLSAGHVSRRGHTDER